MASNRQFSRDYVIGLTLKHMRRSVDLSISKTFERIQEFEADREKSEEIFKTLSDLHALKKQIESFNSFIGEDK
jgi:cephalosporin-C deacetylase-like acetyl esterase